MNILQLSQQKQFIAVPDQVSSDLAGEAVILNLLSGTYFGLNEVGASIWALLQAEQTFASICDAIQMEYEVDRATCEQDVTALLQELQAAQLIEERDDISA
jgi:hypothetical protein